MINDLKVVRRLRKTNASHDSFEDRELIDRCDKTITFVNITLIFMIEDGMSEKLNTGEYF